MAYKLMIQGTMSSSGKSFIVTALCRLFSDMGYKVAPFKSQNMALNSGVTFDGFEMGRAQIVQAEAARTTPDVRMNPVLLKPNSDVGSQVIVMGKPIGNMNAKDYYAYKTSLIPVIKEAFHSLEREYDIIIVEGAGSPAEINLKENDIVNMGLAKMLDIPVLLVGDIDLGGVFAQLLGTLEWLEEDEKDRIKGLLINKFRGDVSLLKPGVDMLCERTGKEVLGVIPYCSAKIDEEDSVTVRESDSPNKSKLAKEEIINIDVIRLPHLSNFTDFTPLSRLPMVSLRYIDKVPSDDADMIIIPGTKSTISDLNWMDKVGLSKYVIDSKVPVMGICGGNQILGNSISDPEGVEGDKYTKGLSLLNQDTVISEDKILKKTKGTIKCGTGFFTCLDGISYSGYEIHSGITNEAICCEDVFGTYVHGIFDKASVTNAIILALAKRKVSYNQSLGEAYIDTIKNMLLDNYDYEDVKDREYDKAASVIKEAIDNERLFEIIGIR